MRTDIETIHRLVDGVAERRNREYEEAGRDDEIAGDSCYQSVLYEVEMALGLELNTIFKVRDPATIQRAEDFLRGMLTQMELMKSLTPSRKG